MSEKEKADHNNETWDITITPKSKLLDLQLQEVWNYRDLLLLLVKRDFTAQYKQTILGPLWHLLQPIMITIMFTIIFDKMAGIPTDGIHAVIFFMSGITIWNYFSACIAATSSTFITNAHLFGKVYFPRLIIPLSVVASNMLRFGIQFLLLLAVMLYYHIKGGHTINFTWTWLFVPFLVMLMAALGLGLGIIVSALTTKYRDLNILVLFGVQLLMYATPIAYPLSFIKNKEYAQFIHYNPLTGIVEAFKYALFQNIKFNPAALVYSIVFTFAAFLIGIVLFNKVEKNFMDTV